MLFRIWRFCPWAQSVSNMTEKWYNVCNQVLKCEKMSLILHPSLPFQLPHTWGDPGGPQQEWPHLLAEGSPHQQQHGQCGGAEGSNGFEILFVSAQSEMFLSACSVVSSFRIVIIWFCIFIIYWNIYSKLESWKSKPTKPRLFCICTAFNRLLLT